MKTQITFLLFLTLTPLAFNACGSQNINHDDTAGASDLASTSGLAAAKCSHDVANLPNLSTRFKIYTDGFGASHNDMIRIKFDRFPSEFSGADTSALKLWTRTIDSAGTWGPWHTVPFYVELNNGTVSQKTPYTYSDLTWAQLKQIATAFGVTSTSSTDIINSIDLIAQLSESDTVSKVITTKLYMSGSSPEVTTLTPVFAANPYQYAKSHPAALQALHPLQALSASYSEDQYQFEADQFCF